MLAEYHSSVGNMSEQGGPLMRLAMHYHRVPNGTDAGGPLSFLEMPFLVQIYRDLPYLDEMVAQKCTQVGWTEVMLVFAIHHAAERGRRWAYVMPHDNLLANFVQERVGPMFERVPYYKELSRASWRQRPAENLRLRHVGSGSWRFVGSRNAANFREFSADAITVDEVDDCEQKNLGLVRDRVRASGSPQLFWLGNPKLPTGGICKAFERSDCRRWYHRCPRCGERQRIDWFENVVVRADDGAWVPRDRERWKGLVSGGPRDPGPSQDIRPVCVRCGKPWTRSADAQWIAENPDHPRRGYHVAQMDHLGRSLWAMFTEFIEAQGDPHALTIFYGSVLGLGYEPKGARLSTVDLDNCTREYSLDYEADPALQAATVVAGIDVGVVLNMTISVVETRHEDPSDPASDQYQVRRAVWVGACRTFDELTEILGRYYVDLAVIDAMPETHKVQELRDHCNWNTDTRVWLCYYSDVRKVGTLPYGMRIDGKSFTVTVDKTAIMDHTFALIRKGRREYPHDIRTVLHWTEHMRAPVRTLDNKGIKFRWNRGNSRDDYRQAECYEKIAMDLLTFSGGYYEFDV